MNVKSIDVLMDELPENNLTVKMLNLLDFVVPGEWENTVGFDAMLEKATEENDEELLENVKERALELYNDSDEGYQRAIWLYETVDTAGTAMGLAALANKTAEKISFLSFLDKITPKADNIQVVDFSLKFVVELIAFCKINGIPGDSIGDFISSLTDNYRGESLMRVATLICVDGLIPLGPDFLKKTGKTLSGLKAPDLENNSVFQKIKEFIPGGNFSGKLGFINEAFTSAKDWMDDFVSSRDLTLDKLKDNLSGAVDWADDKLDFVAATIDITTNYYEHTGIQTVAYRLIERAYEEV
ncbi:MAG: hypothetical protein KDK90_15685 [Leptospiraceae bacterium]|nr:hypothetical protein [Leptospiraceae bacterium]